MKISSLKNILKTLNNNRIKYLIVGGVAVNIHGYQRMTHDLDLVIQLIPENIKNALTALNNIGYSPAVPVTVSELINPEIRQQWITHKNMTVLSLISNLQPDTTLDIFITEPFNFDAEYNSSEIVELDTDLSVHIISLPSLIRMKQKVARNKDIDDIQHLKYIMEEKNEH